MSSAVTSSSACYLTQCAMALPTVLTAVMRATAVPSSQVWDPACAVLGADPGSGGAP
jgi:hypothetical protein